MTAQPIVEGLLDLVYPRKCLVCETLNPHYICPSCLSAIERISRPSDAARSLLGLLGKGALLHDSESGRRIQRSHAGGDPRVQVRRTQDSG